MGNFTPQVRPTRKQLHHLYVEQRISPEKIGKQFGYSGRRIRDFMDECGIPRMGPAHLRKGKSATWNIGIERTGEQVEKNRQAKIGHTPWNKGNGDFTFVCEVCGKVVTDKPYYKKRTCSKKCKNQLSHINRGKHHWNYKSDNPPSAQRQRLWAKTKEWRKSILEIENYTCRKCKQRGGRLVAHHIYAWATYPNKRFDIDNGACLCHACHRELHSLYGQKKSIHKEYEKWITK